MEAVGFVLQAEAAAEASSPAPFFPVLLAVRIPSSWALAASHLTSTLARAEVNPAYPAMV